MVQREIQSVELSCFVHATEDEPKVREAVQRVVGIEAEPTRELLEGHFGNGISHLVWHFTGEEAWNAFQGLAKAMGQEAREEVLGGLRTGTDEHGALYLRLNKQALVRGTVVFSSSDPVRVKVKPRGFMMKGSPEQFYRRVLEVTAR